ncbi:MAG: ribonuclease Y, partial [Planctomycetes bacterium]|nr:ribonuclease Y [Planctomycetota bacterium]
MNDFSSVALMAQALGWTISIVVGSAIGVLVGFMFIRWLGRSRLDAARATAERVKNEAESEAEVLRKTAEIDAKTEFLKGQEQLRAESTEMRAELKEIEKRLAKREDNIEGKLDTLSTKERKLEQDRAKLDERLEQASKREEEAASLIEQRRAQLLKVGQMSVEEARQTILGDLKQELEHECAEVIEKAVSAARDEAQQRSREITLTAIQRFASEHTCDSVVSSVEIPSDDMKGRVIGREGRNIRAFEKSTGVDVIVDDTPGLVLVSAFDPIRREVARRSLERLIQDGRIHPGRIEELVAQVQKEVEEECLETGKRAAVEANVGGLHRKQMDLLGRLRFRTSYGQNVLQHSLESAYLCQLIADELGLDGRLARRCGLLHDIGKAIDHDVEGGHPKVGAEFCKRFNERPEVLNAIEGHHADIPSTSPYTPIVMAADAISA